MDDVRTFFQFSFFCGPNVSGEMKEGLDRGGGSAFPGLSNFTKGAIIGSESTNAAR